MNIRMLNGVGSLGVTATKHRNIKPGLEFDAYFPKPKYRDPMLDYNGANEDTLSRHIPRIVRATLSDTRSIALVLKQSTLEATCKAIWDFIYNHIQYKQDSPYEEQIRTPARSWADRKSGVDCDCYTTLISSILTNLRIPHYLRMSAYRRERGYQHIYVVVPRKGRAIQSRSQYITIDPVMEAFDDEKPFLNKRDHFMPQTLPAVHRGKGLNGIPIRMLNGAPLLRNEYVFDSVYYSPQLKTWAMRGLDGAYYIQADGSKRFVAPLSGLEGLDGKFFKNVGNVVKNVAKVAAPIAAGFLPGGGIASGLISSLTNAKQAGSGDAAQQFIPASPATGANVSASTSAGSADNTAEVKKSILSANKANVMSLQAVDSSMKSRLNAITAELNKSSMENKSLKEMLQHVKEVSLASLARQEQTEAAAKEQEKQGSQMMRMLDKVGGSNTIVLVAIAALGVLILTLQISKNK